MTTDPAPTPAAEATRPHQDVLNRFVDCGDRLVQLITKQAEATTIPVVKAADAYDKVTRSARRSMWLVRKFAEPVKTVDRTGARKQIIRTVEDIIQRHAEDPEEAENLREELFDRLDTLDLEDEIRGRKLDDIITDIVRDLGLAHVPGNHPWARRTPEDVAALCARAAQPVPAVQVAPAAPTPRPNQPHDQPVACNST